MENKKAEAIVNEINPDDCYCVKNNEKILIYSKLYKKERLLLVQRLSRFGINFTNNHLAYYLFFIENRNLKEYFYSHDTAAKAIFVSPRLLVKLKEDFIKAGIVVKTGKTSKYVDILEFKRLIKIRVIARDKEDITKIEGLQKLQTENEKEYPAMQKIQSTSAKIAGLGLQKLPKKINQDKINQKNHHRIDNDNLNLINENSLCQRNTDPKPAFKNIFKENEKSIKKTKVTTAIEKQVNLQEPDLFNQGIDCNHSEDKFQVNKSDEIELELRMLDLDEIQIKKIMKENTLQYLEILIQAVKFMRDNDELKGKSPAQIICWGLDNKKKMDFYIKKYLKSFGNHDIEKDKRTGNCPDKNQILSNVYARYDAALRIKVDEKLGNMDQLVLTEYKNRAEAEVIKTHNLKNPFYNNPAMREFLIDSTLKDFISKDIDYTFDEFLKETGRERLPVFEDQRKPVLTISQWETGTADYAMTIN